MPTLNLSVKCDATSWGEQVAVVGSWNSWNKREFTKLSTSPQTFPKWTTHLQLSDTQANGSVEYKYVIVKDGSIARWEGDGGRNNRVINLSDVPDRTDVFGDVSGSREARGQTSASAIAKMNGVSNGVYVSDSSLNANLRSLDALEIAIVKKTLEQKSWRQRLAFIRSLFTEGEVAKASAFTNTSVDALATISIYLTFLSSGQVKCEEDGGHHRPNHHAHEARQIERSLADITRSVVERDASNAGLHSPDSYIPYVIRKIFPVLPSYSSQFTVSVPLTRIRDIAHRGDLPRDLKQEIKHTLQNKLHRCAGPEDLQTSARILERINHGNYSQPFVEQFNIFHAELCAFFNASSLDDRLNYLKHDPATKPVSQIAAKLLSLKHEWRPTVEQLAVQTQLRKGIADLKIMKGIRNSEGDDELPTENIQKTRLADIDLENYAFLLLADVAKGLENQTNSENFPWSYALLGLAEAMENMRLSNICRTEAQATATELYALSRAISTKSPDREGLLRVKAAVDRALRFAHNFSTAISDVYMRRVQTIGQALGVDSHAIDVFAEAEIRSNVTFQASRMADACARACRKALSLPPWDPLYTGRARGRVVFAEALADVVVKNGEEVIGVCRTADGDEDIPAGVRGVVLGRALPHLSHLGVRARQAGVVFVCAEERSAFENVWSKRKLDKAVLVVNEREGLASLSEAGNDVEEIKSKGNEESGNEKEVGQLLQGMEFDGTSKTAIPIVKADIASTSSKCTYAGKLRGVAESSDGLFEAADGVALPHGMFQDMKQKHKGKYDELVQAYDEAYRCGKGVDEAAQAVQEFVRREFVMSNNTCEEICKHFEKGCRVMVRSSANAEDLEEMSGAGLYDSYANVDVNDVAGLKEAVSKVWASVWTKRAASSRASYGVKHERVSMAVLVQKMVRSELSFVAFSEDPVSRDAERVYVEVAVGMGETLASATCDGSPYRFAVVRKGMKVETASFGSYGVEIVAGEEGVRQRVVDYSAERMTTDAEFREEIVGRIARVVMSLEKEFGGAQDVEGAVVGCEGVGRLFVVQARPQVV